jgi:hypothetical protein
MSVSCSHVAVVATMPRDQHVTAHVDLEAWSVARLSEYVRVRFLACWARCCTCCVGRVRLLCGCLGTAWDSCSA